MASEAIASWSNSVPEFNYSTEQFYKLLEAKIKAREIPDVKMTTKNISQGGIFSANRLYFEVSRKDYIFHVCAAPFGRDFFFSWYLRVKMSRWQELLVRIPYIGPSLVKGMQYQSYYQLDTANMFKQSIHSAITSTIDEVLELKGQRLSEFDRRLRDS